MQQGALQTPLAIVGAAAPGVCTHNGRASVAERRACQVQIQQPGFQCTEPRRRIDETLESNRDRLHAHRYTQVRHACTQAGALTSNPPLAPPPTPFSLLLPPRALLAAQAGSLTNRPCCRGRALAISRRTAYASAAASAARPPPAPPPAAVVPPAAAADSRTRRDAFFARKRLSATARIAPWSAADDPPALPAPPAPPGRAAAASSGAVAANGADDASLARKEPLCGPPAGW